MRVAIETELDAPRDDPSTVLTESVQQLDRLESTISGLLALARHGGRPVERFDLETPVRTVVAAHRLRLGADRSIELEGDSVEVETDRIAVEHVVDVLVDNAVRHGAGTITVIVAGGPGGARVDVLDDGEVERDRDVFTEQTADGGHGIGLRLARTLAESTGGSLVLHSDAPTTFRFALPNATDHVYPALT